MTVGIHNNCYTCRHCCPADARDIGGSLLSYRADTNRISLASNTLIAYRDVAASGGQVEARLIA
jgi:hypothetical protein